MSKLGRQKLRSKSDENGISSQVIHQRVRARRARLGVLILSVALASMLSACGDSGAKVALAGKPVQVLAVTERNERSATEFVGTVHARHETDLAFRVAGKVTARLVNAGDHVKSGQIIAQLEQDDLGLQVQSAQAELAAAKSSLNQAAADERRYAKLKTDGWVSNAGYEQKKSARDEAAGRADRASQALELARNQLAYSNLTADADGVITETLIEPGQVVAVGQTVARLAQDGDKEAVVALPETWLGDVQSARASVRLWADSARVFKAHLRELSPQADPATRTYAARFTIEDADNSVALGMTATVLLEQSAAQAVTEIPLSAVFNRGHGPDVFLVSESGKLVLRPVQVASFTEESALITGGVRTGDRIVTLGVQKLNPDESVRIVEMR